MNGQPRPPGEPIVVGVTGHRWVGPATEGLHDAVVALFGCLSRVARDERRPLTVLSSLAEGADRLVAHEGLRHRLALDVILPLDAGDYARDFPDTADEFADLLGRARRVDVVPPAGDRTDAYLAAGIAVLARADLLVAIWDGQPARGRGGTAEIVAEARTAGYPLAWLHVGPADGGEFGTYEATHKERWPWPA